LIWELDYSEKAFSIQSRAARGLPPPEWLENEPIMAPGDEFYLTAFYQLSSCRQVGGDLPGSIPWDKIVQYADRRQLDPDVARAFEHIMQAMDEGYLQWYQKRQKALMPKPIKVGKQ
jgi:hypothetical protein